jgi:hypothetical protein
LLLAIKFQTGARPPHKLGFVDPKFGAHLLNRFKFGAATLGGGFLGGFRLLRHRRPARLDRSAGNESQGRTRGKGDGNVSYDTGLS